MTGGGYDRNAKQRTRRERRAGMIEPAAATRERQRTALRHKQLANRDILAAGGRHAHGEPGIDDLVIGLGHRAEPPVHGFATVVVDGDVQYVPVAVVDGGRERPAAVDDEAAVGLAGATGCERNGGGNQCILIGVPHFVLGRGIVIAEDPVMAADVADIPGRRWAAARELGRKRGARHERELHYAKRLRLVKAKQPGLVPELLVFADQGAGVLGALSALAQDWYD